MSDEVEVRSGVAPIPEPEATEIRKALWPTTLEMIEAAVPSIVRASWCVEMNPECIGVLIDGGDTRAAAVKIETVAEHRSMAIKEICRVRHGDREAAFARCEPIPFVAPESDHA